MKKRTSFLSVALLVILVMFFTGCASPSTPTTTAAGTAQTTTQEELKFPEKSIELVVGYAAGGGTHLAAELLTPNSQQYLKHPISISNIPGAGGAVGATYVAKSKADGYTLLYATVSLPASLYMSDVDFVQEDFVGVAMASSIAPVIVARADAPYNTAEEMEEWIRANPNTFTWGFPGIGSSLHLTGANLWDAMGVSDIIRDVPFDGTAESVAAVLGGHISAVSCFPTSISEQVRAGQMKIIGVQAAERVEDYPDVPTFLEQGYNATLTSWRGVFAPKDTPQEILDYLDKAFGEIIMSEEYLVRAVELGEGRYYKNAAEFTEIYNNECALIEALVEKLGLTN
jgi:tripartite-type tricarboxylate transporter receptor subunit TctC